jgi:hypothetical protein
MGIKYKARRSLPVDQTLNLLFAGRDTMGRFHVHPSLALR